MEEIPNNTGFYEQFNKILVHPSFKDTIEEINRMNIQLPNNPVFEEWDMSFSEFPNMGGRVIALEEIKAYKLNAKTGQDIIQQGHPIVAYDESIQKFEALEGSAYLTSHSLTLLGKEDYIPLNLITFYFYTRSNLFTTTSKYIKSSINPLVDSKLDYISDRTKFLVKNVPRNSILFIDGPLLGGQVIHQTLLLNNELFENNIIPIFFVKNSTSNLVTDQIESLRGKFNSDLHWCFHFLKPGERTNFFKFEDPTNKAHAKIFCYIKAYDGSPQRIEMYVNIFDVFKNKIQDLLDIIYYLLLVQGDSKNPQLRPIIISEKFARASLKLFDLQKIMNDLGIIATINQDRFGGDN